MRVKHFLVDFSAYNRGNCLCRGNAVYRVIWSDDPSEVAKRFGYMRDFLAKKAFSDLLKSTQQLMSGPEDLCIQIVNSIELGETEELTDE